MIDIDKYNLFIFDMDGTLVDTTWIWNSSVQKLVSRLVPDIDINFLKSIGKMTSEEAIDLTVETYNIKHSPEKLLTDDLVIIASEFYNKITLKEYAIDFLKLLKEKNKKIIIATSNMRNLTDIVLHSTEIGKLIDDSITTDELPIRKNNPEYFKTILDKYNSSPNQCLFFEDSSYSIKTANSMGIDCVGVFDEIVNSHHIDELEKYTIKIIKSFQEIM